MGRRADRKRKAAGLPKRGYDPREMIDRCKSELVENPYNIVAINTLRNCYKKTGQIDLLNTVLAHAQAIIDSRSNHSSENIDIEEVRPVFNRAISDGKYDKASDILICIARHPKRDPREIDNLLSDANKVPPQAIRELIQILTPSFITYDIGVLCALGYLHKNVDDKRSAVRVLKQGISLYRKHEPIRYALQTLTSKKSPKLMREATALLKLDPQNIEYATILAAGYLRFDLPAFAIRTLEPFSKRGQANEQSAHLLALGYIRNNDFKSADNFLVDFPSGGLPEIELARAFMKGDDKRAAALALGVIQTKFDPLATAIFVITSGLAGRWLNSSMRGGQLSALIEPRHIAKVQEKVESLQKDRGIIIESLIAEAWHGASQRLTKIRTSSVYEDSDLRPVNRAAVRDVYRRYVIDC